MRQVIDDELREAGVRLRDLDVRLELGLQESARSAVLAGYGVTFISRSAIEADLAAGTLAVGRVEGLEPSREISLVRSAGRARDARRPGVRRVRARAARVIVRWGLDALPGLLGSPASTAPLLVASPRWDGLELPVEPAALDARCPRTASRRPRHAPGAASSRSAAAARSISARRSRRGGRAARLRADDLLRCRVDDVLRRARPGPARCAAAAGARIRAASSTTPS